MRNKILIYAGAGANDVSRLKAFLEKTFAFSKIKVFTVNAEDIKYQNVLNDEVLAFFMPGGEADIYAKHLEQAGKKNIRSYVEQGGIYFGICAGAYFACDKIVFQEEQGKKRIITEDCLGLVSAEAHGTIEPYLDKGKTLPTDMVVDLKDSLNDQSYAAHYHKGPYFVLKNNKQTSVLAHYVLGNQKLPGVVFQSNKLGQVVLSGVHWENSAFEFEQIIKKMPSYQSKVQKIASDLRLKEHLRRALAQKLMQFARAV